MKQEIDSVRGTKYVIRMGAIPGIVCQCGSGEVWQYPQTLGMPMYAKCLKCGDSKPIQKFEQVGEQ